MTTHFGVCLQALLENYGKSRETRVASVQYSRTYMESMSLTLQTPRQHGLTTAIRNVYGKRPVMYVTGRVEELLNATVSDGTVKNTIHIVQDLSVRKREDGFKPETTLLYDPRTYQGYFDELDEGEVPTVIFVYMMYKFERGLKRNRVINAILEAAGDRRPDILFLG